MGIPAHRILPKPLRYKRLRKTLAGVLLLLGPGMGMAQADLGDIPLVNQLQGTSVFNLNFTQPGAGQQVAVFLVNSNDPDGFSVTFTFSNLGRFGSGGNSFAMSTFVLNGIDGTLGAGLTAPANQSFTLDGSGSWTWSPGNSPTTETVNYLIEIKVNWTDQSSSLAGLYRETINAVITGGP
jgi:hypothetical protein